MTEQPPCPRTCPRCGAACRDHVTCSVYVGLGSGYVRHERPHPICYFPCGGRRGDCRRSVEAQEAMCRRAAADCGACHGTGIVPACAAGIFGPAQPERPCRLCASERAMEAR